MSEFYMLVGLPGSGKSTWKEKFLSYRSDGEWVVLSTDDFIENYAKGKMISYNDAFKISGVYVNAAKELNTKLEEAIASGSNIIWDQTNLSASSRKSKISAIPAEYRKIAVHVMEPAPREWRRRLRARPGKSIPENVMEQMLENYTEPALDEGFDEIIKVSTDGD